MLMSPQGTVFTQTNTGQLTASDGSRGGRQLLECQGTTQGQDGRFAALCWRHAGFEGALQVHVNAQHAGQQLPLDVYSETPFSVML